MSLVSIIKNILGTEARMICGSKTMYKQQHPSDIIYTNATIFDGKGKAVWWGDINLTEDIEKLKKISSLDLQPIYVAPEHPYRTDFFKPTLENLVNDARVFTFYLGEVEKKEDCKTYLCTNKLGHKGKCNIGQI